MSTQRTWHGQVALGPDGEVKVLAVYVDKPTIFTGKLSVEAPKLSKPKPMMAAR